MPAYFFAQNLIFERLFVKMGACADNGKAARRRAARPNFYGGGGNALI